MSSGSRVSEVPPRVGWVRHRWLPPVAIGFLTFAAFLPVLQNQFVNWDDLANVVENPSYRGLGWRELKWMFTTFHESLYRPITWMTLGWDYLLWGMNPAGYHLTSLLFHCANAVLIYFIAVHLLRLALAPESASEAGLRAGAAFAAFFFSLHPLRVEAVAWVSARNDVVSASFFLLALLGYLRASAPSNLHPSAYRRRLVGVMLLYAVSLLAKASSITFPLVLLIVDVYPLRRLQGAPWRWFEAPARTVLLEKIPFVGLALGAAVVALIAKKEFQAVHSLASHGWLVRIHDVFYGLVFYLWKTLVPVGLSPLYQRPPQSQLEGSLLFASVAAVALLTAGVIWYRRKWPAAAACWAWYIAVLIPFLGLIQFGPQVTADRYSYLSCLGLALVAGAMAASFFHGYAGARIGRGTFGMVMLLCAGGLIGLASLSWRQSRVWEDSIRLWRHVLALNPNATYGYHNLAAEMKRSGDIAGAIQNYRKVIELDPRFALAHVNLGDIFAERGEFDSAEAAYRNALQVDPNSPVVYHKLGSLYTRQGRNRDAVWHFSKALEIEPKYVRAHNDLGNVLVTMGEVGRAAEHFRTSAALDRSATEPLFNLGNLMVRLNQPDRAIAYYQRALDIDPRFVHAHNNLGRALAARGDLDQAIYHFREATRLEPTFAAAHESLIQALLEQGKKEEAWRHYQSVQKFLGPGGSNASSR